jgi:hypothetical protein
MEDAPETGDGDRGAVPSSVAYFLYRVIAQNPTEIVRCAARFTVVLIQKDIAEHAA